MRLPLKPFPGPCPFNLRLGSNRDLGIARRTLIKPRSRAVGSRFPSRDRQGIIHKKSPCPATARQVSGLYVVWDYAKGDGEPLPIFLSLGICSSDEFEVSPCSVSRQGPLLASPPARRVPDTAIISSSFLISALLRPHPASAVGICRFC